MAAPPAAVSLLRSARKEAQRTAALDNRTGEALGRQAAREVVGEGERHVLRRWRVTENIREGGLNVRAAPSKDAVRLLTLQKLTIVEASGPPEGDATGQWLPIWNPQAPDTRAYAMLEDEARSEVCLEPLDGVTWWQVTDRTQGRGLNLRREPDMKASVLGVVPHYMVLKAMAPPIVPAPSNSRYGSGSLQLRRWRVSVVISPGKLNCRARSGKDEVLLLKIIPKAIVEAVGPPRRVEGQGEWLEINLDKISRAGWGPAAVDAKGWAVELAKPGTLPETGWVMLKDDSHSIPRLRGVPILDPIDGDAAWLKVANPYAPGQSAWVMLHNSAQQRIFLEPMSEQQQSAGMGTLYEVIAPTVVRSGLDALSPELGALESGAHIVALETTIHSGRVRIKCVLPSGGNAGRRGWASVTSGSGGLVLAPLKVRPNTATQGSAEGGGSLWDRESASMWAGDYTDQAKQWLLLQGASETGAERIVRNLGDAGAQPEQWLGMLTHQSSAATQAMVGEVEQKLAFESELAGIMERAGALMVEGKYDGALMCYSQVLGKDPDHEEARRGVTEAEKGRKFANMSEEELLASAQALSMHAELGLEHAEQPGQRWTDATAQFTTPAYHPGAGALVTPSQPEPHQQGHGQT